MKLIIKKRPLKLVKACKNIGDTVEIDVRKGEVILKLASNMYTLDALLNASPNEALHHSEEDQIWLDENYR
jgi:hypothetical protein